MKVNAGNTGPLRPDRPLDPKAPSSPSVDQVRSQPVPKNDRHDRVEISAAGRARASRLEPVSQDAADRLSQIRRRVLEGAYEADAIVGNVAKRILDRGDA